MHRCARRAGGDGTVQAATRRGPLHIPQRIKRRICPSCAAGASIYQALHRCILSSGTAIADVALCVPAGALLLPLSLTLHPFLLARNKKRGLLGCSRCNCDLRQPIAVLFITGDVGSRRPPSSCWASALAATASAPVLFVLTSFGSAAAAPAVSPAAAVVGDAVSDSNLRPLYRP